jgi:tetratricopeptide (TPR) repeat protein
VYQESGQADKAMALVEKAAGENPQDAKAQYNRGIFLLNATKNEEAIAAFEAALKADPALAEPYYHLGTLMVGQNKIPEAVQNLEKYLSLNPTNAQNVATAQGLLKALKPK